MATSSIECPQKIKALSGTYPGSETDKLGKIIIRRHFSLRALVSMSTFANELRSGI